jgi:hypothetical protein
MEREGRGIKNDPIAKNNRVKIIGLFTDHGCFGDHVAKGLLVYNQQDGFNGIDKEKQISDHQLFLGWQGVGVQVDHVELENALCHDPPAAKDVPQNKDNGVQQSKQKKQKHHDSRKLGCF